ncbi:hypothetical protein CMU19_18625 [Elizabethkingia anophelis]|nr:hypothetical protein [Elizabethkingia anophelis]
MKNKKIFIAGHKGMVGSAIYQRLFQYRYKNLIVKSSAELDLRNQEDVKSFFIKEQPEIVIDAAAKVGGIMANSTYPYQFLMDNIQIQNNLIDGAHRFNVEKFIFLGSSCIYPKLAEQPLKEESLLTGALEPTNEWYANYYRPTEVDLLIGDPSRAFQKLGWKAKYTLDGLIREMVINDLNLV